jgi:hypothetical protein
MVSCNSWETKKIPSEIYLAKDWEAIDLNQVDTYPSFEACSDLVGQLAIKKCFEREMTSAYTTSLKQTPFIVSTPIDDTLWIDMIVNEKGSLCIDSIRMRELTRKELPLLASYIQQTAIDMPKIEAATKRGVPVKTKFRLPVILKVD